MFIYKQNDSVPWERCVATVGFFDGVHRGHRFLLEELRCVAKAKQMISVVVTFDEHPRKVIKSDYRPQLLTTLNEKLELLSEVGVDAVVVLNFTVAMSQMSAKQFMEDVLVKQLYVKKLLVGYDHRFGHNRNDGFDEYRIIGQELGMSVIQADKFNTIGLKNFSSSEIRSSLLTGKVDIANQLLSYPYTFTGKVIGGMKRGRTIGFPTANLLFDNKEKLIPAVGVYAVRVLLHKEEYKGMMNIGYNPTFHHQDREVSIEVHIIDFDKDIYEKKIKIECIRYLRNEISFSSVNELINQLKADREEVINLDF